MPIIIKPSQLEESAKLGAQFRHCIHEEPEIGLYLPKTQEKIVNALKSFGIKEISTFVGGANVTGVVAVIEGSRPGKTIGLRADSDAKKKPASNGAVKFRWRCTPADMTVMSAPCSQRFTILISTEISQED